MTLSEKIRNCEVRRAILWREFKLVGKVEFCCGMTRIMRTVLVSS
jgi:hypothetical protein